MLRKDKTLLPAQVERCAAAAFRSIAFAVVTLALLAGCSLVPPLKRPATEAPAQWTDVPTQGALAIGDRWWTIYGDPLLDKLVEEAVAQNRDLAVAASRVDEARAQLRVTGASLYPTVDVNASAARSRLSERGAVPLPRGASFTNNSYTATLDVAYEVDLWGRLRGATQAARAQVLASQAARDTIRIALASQVVQSYFALIGLDEQIDVTRRTIGLREQNLELQNYRYKSGLITDFNLRQLEAEVSAARAQLPALEQRRASTEVALSILLGRSPRAIVSEAVARERNRRDLATAVIPEGLPSDLLLRRPDIAQAEQVLIASNAEIGVARAAMFPRISLTGYLGSDSRTLGDLFSGPATIWQLAFGLAQPIFNAGRLRAQVDAATAREQQAVAQYQKTVQVAFGEVREALVAQSRTREVFAAEDARVTALSETLRLARIRFENGLSSQLDVIDAERNLLQAELNRVDALRAQRAAVADVVRALGGGWQGLDGSTVQAKK